MISTTAKYALRATVFMAGHKQGYVGRAEIAQATLVPHDYLLKVLNGLDAAGIVESRRGPGGGYRLTRASNRITSLEVVLSVDDIPRIKECPLALAEHVKLCPLHKLLDEASRLVEQSFRNATIADLAPKRTRSNSCDFPNAKRSDEATEPRGTGG